MSEKTSIAAPYQATVLDVQPARMFGGRGDAPVAVLQNTDNKSEAWLPVNEAPVSVGETVFVTPVTRYIGEKGGSITTFSIHPAEQQA